MDYEQYKIKYEHRDNYKYNAQAFLYSLKTKRLRANPCLILPFFLLMIFYCNGTMHDDNDYHPYIIYINVIALFISALLSLMFKKRIYKMIRNQSRQENKL